MGVELYISELNGVSHYIPAVEEGIELLWERHGTPGKIRFSVLFDDLLKIEEGMPVSLKVDGKNVFYGFVFSKKEDKKGIVEITAYDQLRYLKNKDTYIYENKTASQLIENIAKDFKLKLGNLADTEFIIQSRVEDNVTLFDMIENALDITLQNKGRMFVMYDDFGAITLKEISDMKVGGDSGGYLLIDEESAENFEYESTIDVQTYNQIKLIDNNSKDSSRAVYITKDSSHINQWGLLQYFGTIAKGEDSEKKADQLLKLYNQKTRNLRIVGAFGDIRVRGGSLVLVNLKLHDMKLQNFMLVEKVVHKFKHEEHFMDLTLRGGGL